ncbi:MAG: RNA 3'-terminal phosphate cyclase [bacterium]|nr:RNA 3'-terminal phosphate cyclase [bacterium]
MIEIDGSAGEGGGQVLRSAVALSMVRGVPIRVRNIRVNRPRPGLRRQHLTAVQAAAAISGGRLDGAALGSTELELEPGPVAGGDYRFAVGTAGSTTLVLQTVLPALLTAPSPSSLVLEGGTHNPMAPPFPFLARTFLPLIERMGPRVTATLERPGFHPAGGGRIRLEIEPCERLRGFELHERGKVRARRVTALLAHLPRHIGERELRLVQKKSGWPSSGFSLEEIDSDGPGNLLTIELESEALTETFTGFGRPRLRAEVVAQRTFQQARRYLKAGVPVGEHLADQLLLPLALAGGGAFTTLPLSRHATTQIDLLGRFLDVPIVVDQVAPPRTVVRIGRHAKSLTSS